MLPTLKTNSIYCNDHVNMRLINNENAKMDMMVETGIGIRNLRKSLN